MDDDSPAIGGDALATGRRAARRSDWAQAHAALSRADASSPLSADDLELLGMAAYLLGNVGGAVEALRRAHRRHLERGGVLPAVRCAFWIGLHLINAGELGQAGGWLSRANRLTEDRSEEGAEHAYVLLPAAFQTIVAGDHAAGRETAARAAEIGRRCGDADVVAMALNIEGRALVYEGLADEGMAALDEAMVAVVAGEVSAPVAGLVYCSVIEACDETSDVRRAREWTAALTDWCDRQQGMVTFTGQCLVHRAAIRQLHGEWNEAVDEALRACERLAAAGDVRTMAAATYRLGELHRCRGDTRAAEDAYREAGHRGYDPQPGLALLRLAQGRRDAAVAAITRALEETTGPIERARLLPAFVEIRLAAGDVAAADRAAGELDGIAATYGTTALAATAGRARGAVVLAEGDPGGALSVLRRAAKLWQEVDAVYEEACVRVLVAQACRTLGDGDGAALELEAAGRVFDRLGARHDLAQVEVLTTSEPGAAAHGLTPRELEVLRLVATGMTNRAIARELVLAVKTVDRHVSSILSKLGVSSRAAATAYAYQHELA